MKAAENRKRKVLVVSFYSPPANNIAAVRIGKFAKYLSHFGWEPIVKFDLSAPFMLKSIAASAIMVLCIWLVNPESITMVVVSIFAGALIYSSALLLMKGLSKSEITLFMNFVREGLRKIPMVR